MSLRAHAPMTPWLFVAPAAACLLVFVGWAFAQVVFLSFTRVDLFQPGTSLLSKAHFVGLENYQRILASDRFWWCLANSFLYLLVTPAIMVISLSAALCVTSGLRGLGALRVLIFLPVITPTIVAAVAWRALFNEQTGLINSSLNTVGIPDVPWLSGYPWVLVTAMIVTLWKGFGYYMMIFVAALMAVPKELEEAATIDGAGRSGVFWNVTLPSIKPVLVLVSVISSISALKVFDELFVTVRGTPPENQTVVPLIFETAFDDGAFGAACAIGVCLFLILLVFSLVQLKVVER
jgi:putative chitobiose transport system permease protein